MTDHDDLREETEQLDARVELQKRLSARIARLEKKVKQLKTERDGAFAELDAVDDAFKRCGNPIAAHDNRVEKLVNILTANKNMAELLIAANETVVLLNGEIAHLQSK
jgi:glycerol-3-phosphate responsive antiterminator